LLTRHLARRRRPQTSQAIALLGVDHLARLVSFCLFDLNPTCR
jgi:hypothetical protein